MTSKKSMQKLTVCIALIALLFAFVAIFAIAGLHMPAQTASAEPQGGGETDVGFGKVTDDSQIKSENIDQCTLEKAKGWVTAFWDDVKNTDATHMDIAYYDGTDLYVIYITASMTIDDFYTVNATKVIVEDLIVYYSIGDDVYLCGFEGGSQGSTHVHSYDTDWSSDISAHWHACIAEGICDEPTKDVEAHTYGEDVGETAYYTCSVCGYEDADRKAEYEAQGQSGGIEVSVVKWESADIPPVDRRLTADDMEGFIPTTREIAIQWLPPENAQRTLLIYDVGEDYIATIEYSGGRYWSDDVNHDTITCENFLEMRELGVVLYYTGVKENSGIVTPSKVAEPIILPEGEVQNGTITVRLFCETDGATIYYTLDGSIPNEHSRVYEPGSTVTVSENATIRAIAMKAGMEKSVMASESFNSGTPSGKGSGKSDNIIQYEGDPIPGKETGKAKHGFCVGWVVFIFAILELLYLGLYFVLWFPKAAFLIDKCKLGALKSIKEGKILFGVVDLLAFIGLCVSCGVFLFALIALCCHACAVTAVSFVLALLVLAAFVAIFVLDHKDLVKGWMEKICKKEKKGETTEVASESTELPAEEKVPTDNDQE